MYFNEIEYDEYAEFYRTNILETLKLYTLTTSQLDELASPTFAPLYELESELEYAFLPVLFDTVFRNKLIATKFKAPLLNFRKSVDAIPTAVWDWNFIDSHPQWIAVRTLAKKLLNSIESNGVIQ